MITYLRQREDGNKINHGFNLYIKADLPSGSGLSSSAAIEMLMGMILKDEFDLDIDRPDLARLGQKTENEFIGLNSGIMDQFACIMGKNDSAIFICKPRRLAICLLSIIVACYLDLASLYLSMSVARAMR